MKNISLLTLLLVLSCVNDPISDDGGGKICPAHAPLYQYLSIEFTLNAANPVKPNIEIEGQPVDYCFSGQEKDYCLFNLTSSFQKLTYTIAAKKIILDASVELFDDTTKRLSRTTEEMTTVPSEHNISCFGELDHILKIVE